MCCDGILHRYSVAVLLCATLFACASEHNKVRLVKPASGKVAYRQLSTDHYLFVDGNHVAEAERGERRVTFVLRSQPEGAALLYAQFKFYPEDAIHQPQLEFHLNNQVLRLQTRLVRQEALAEQVTILESGDGMRTNPTIGTDVQAQSGYITFGRPTGAGAAKRFWQVLVLEAELEPAMLEAIAAAESISAVLREKSTPASVEFSLKQREAWQRFCTGKTDE